MVWTASLPGQPSAIPRLIDAGEIVWANRLRRMARQKGLDVRASPGPDRGTYALVDPVTDAILAGFTLDRIETFFWTFCDDYVELVKSRAYGTGDGAASARRALELALSVQLRLFAPYLPFATEETWSWWHDGSIHATTWPSVSEIPRELGTSAEILGAVATVLGEVRHAKTVAKVSMRAKVNRVEVRGPSSLLELVAQAESDLCDAGSIEGLEFIADETTEKLEVEVELAPPEDAGQR